MEASEICDKEIVAPLISHENLHKLHAPTPPRGEFGVRQREGRKRREVRKGVERGRTGQDQAEADGALRSSQAARPCAA